MAGRLAPYPVTKVVTLWAGSSPVKEPFDTLTAPWGARVRPASVNQDVTPDEAPFPRVND